MLASTHPEVLVWLSQQQESSTHYKVYSIRRFGVWFDLSNSLGIQVEDIMAQLLNSSKLEKQENTNDYTHLPVSGSTVQLRWAGASVMLRAILVSTCHIKYYILYKRAIGYYVHNSQSWKQTQLALLQCIILWYWHCFYWVCRISIIAVHDCTSPQLKSVTDFQHSNNVFPRLISQFLQW